MGTPIKLRLPDGNNRILLVGTALSDQLPERAGTEVQIDYLFGSEAVVSVKALSAAASSTDSENQESKEE